MHVACYTHFVYSTAHICIYIDRLFAWRSLYGKTVHLACYIDVSLHGHFRYLEIALLAVVWCSLYMIDSYICRLQAFHLYFSVRVSTYVHVHMCIYQLFVWCSLYMKQVHLAYYITFRCMSAAHIFDNSPFGCLHDVACIWSKQVRLACYISFWLINSAHMF